MVSKVLVALCLTVAVALALPAQPAGPGGFGPPAWAGGAAGANPWIPPWVATAPWYPQWTPCTTVGSDCMDCNTKVVCTKIGGIQRACSDPTKPYCNLGECSATPTAACAPPAVPASVTV